MLNKNIYREFHTYQEASEWGMSNYGKWLLLINNNNISMKEEDVAYLLSTYTGSMNIIYNQFLRGYGDFDESEIAEYTRDINIIEKAICQYELNENIIVHRYIHKKLLLYLFESKKPKVGELFTDKGFVSTTLVKSLLKDFAKMHHYNCILKLYLPKGTKGVYINFEFSMLNEEEFLLPPNMKFRLVKKYLNWDLKYIYECILENS